MSKIADRSSYGKDRLAIAGSRLPRAVAVA